MDPYPRFPGPTTATGLIAVVTALVLLVAAPAPADPRGDKKRVDADVARAAAVLETATGRARGAARRLAAAAALLPAAQSRVGQAHGRVAAAAALAGTAHRKAAAALAALSAATRSYAEAQSQVERARQRVASVASASYRGSGLVALNVVIDGRGPTDIMARIGYVEQALENQRGAIDVLTTARRAARQAQLRAEGAARTAEAARRSAQDSLREANTAAVAARQAAAAVAVLAAQRRSALAVASQERAASLARYAQAKAEAARVERELRAWEARQKAGWGSGGLPSLRPGSKFMMPVRGWKSSDFGMRFDPFFGVWQLHAGTDFAAGGGSPIYAAADGRVIRAGWNGGYGNLTCLSHGRQSGRGLSTCYAHQSRIMVWPGQRVRRGQVIGRVGTTGASTGNHLHFEVRLDGRPRQPLGWLPGCLC